LKNYIKKNIFSINSEFLSHFIKYNFVGVANAIFTFFIYFALLKVFDVNYLVSFSFSWLAGVILTYIINFKCVFKPERQLVFRSRLLKYFIVYFTSYSINMLLLGSVKELSNFDPLVIQLFILPIVIVINFLGIKYWSMNPHEG
jgi:putative flippase GtrA